jgi:ABC-type transport system involved in cytochrome bd biosynthesis fused ATPase/permease subunit
MTAAITDPLNGVAELHAFGAVETGLERARAVEAVTALPAAALQLGQARTAADRIAAVADTPDPVRRPDRPFPPPERPVTISISGASVTHPGQDLAAYESGTHAELVRCGGVYQRLRDARRRA